MRTSTSIGRVAGTLATTALIGLVTIAPASARPDPGPGYTWPGSAPDQRIYQSDIERQNADQMRNKATAPKRGPATVTIDDNAVEYLQVGLGVLGGMVVVGAIAVGSARRHGHAHPA